jgi:Zn-dependent protease with chaperone function
VLPDLGFLIALLLGVGALAGSPEDPTRALLGSLACLVVGGALSRMAAQRGLRALDAEEVAVAEASARWSTLWPLAAWLGAVGGFDYGAWVNVTVPRSLWIARYVVLLAPMVVVFAVGWAARAEVETAILGRRGGLGVRASARDAVMRGLRRNALILLPLLALIGITEGVWALGHLGIAPLRVAALWLDNMPLLSYALIYGLILAAMPFIPRIFARALRAEPLAPGRLRSVLERAAAKIHLDYRDILVWRTGGRVLNAMVVGFTPGTRVIFLTDGLMNVLSEDEILAVFFHEAGHAKRNHLWLFFLMFLALSLLFHAAELPLQAIGIGLGVQMGLYLAIFWFVLLGWVSRRFERESDIYGAEHAAVLDPDAPGLPLPGLPITLPRGPAMMVRALDRIRTVMGYSGSHRHGSVEDRMAYVTQYAIDPGVRLAFRRTMRNLKLCILILLALSLVLVGTGLPGDLARAGARIDAAHGQRAYERALALQASHRAQDADAAPQAWREAYERFAAASHRLGDRDDVGSRELRVQAGWNAGDVALHGLRDPDRARPWFEKVLKLLDAWQAHGTQAAYYRFNAHVDLGRIAAWDYAALPPGDPGRKADAMLAHEEAAKRLLALDLEQDEAFARTHDRYLTERLRLLAATIEAARGEGGVARPALEKLAELREDTPEFTELARDARLELQRLEPKPDPKDKR